MKLDITGLHIEVTDAIKSFIEKKVKGIEKYFDDDTICHVTFSAKKEKQKVDIRIEYRSHTFLAEEETNDLYYGIETVLDKLKDQIRKYKEMKDRERKHESPREVGEVEPLEDV